MHSNPTPQRTGRTPLSVAAELVMGRAGISTPTTRRIRRRVGQDFLVYRCKDRVAVFAKPDSSSTTPTAADQSWWASNGCIRYPIETLGHTYFELTQTVAQAASADSPPANLPPATQPPAWVGDSTEIPIELVSLYDIRISWPPTSGSPDVIELTVTDSSGVSQPFPIDARRNADFTLNKFDGHALVQGEEYSLTLTALNGAGSSEPLTASVPIPKIIASSTTTTTSVPENLVEAGLLSRSASLFPAGEHCFDFQPRNMDLRGGPPPGTEPEAPYRNQLELWVRGQRIAHVSQTASSHVCTDGETITSNSASSSRHSCVKSFTNIALVKDLTENFDPAGTSRAANEFECKLTLGFTKWGLPFGIDRTLRIEHRLAASGLHVATFDSGQCC